MPLPGVLSEGWGCRSPGVLSEGWAYRSPGVLSGAGLTAPFGKIVSVTNRYNVNNMNKKMPTENTSTTTHTNRENANNMNQKALTEKMSTT